MSISAYSLAFQFRKMFGRLW